MVVVTGTKRSGTSLWMRMLIEAGLPYLGEAFPSIWGESIRDANPHGFFESRLRKGVFFATNPDPKTGEYLPSNASRMHVVKIFVPGVVRTERAYLYRVVATLRHWRSYTRSIEALYVKEDVYLEAPPPENKTGEEAVAHARAQRSKVPPPMEWFLENYELMRDFAVRRYPINFSAYEKLLADPEPLLAQVFEWIGHGDKDKALGAIDESLQRSKDRPAVASEEVVDPATAQLFEDFYAAIHDGSSIPKALLDPLNETWARLSEAYARPDSRRVADAATGVQEDGPALR